MWMLVDRFCKTVRVPPPVDSMIRHYISIVSHHANLCHHHIASEKFKNVPSLCSTACMSTHCHTYGECMYTGSPCMKFGCLHCPSGVCFTGFPPYINWPVCSASPFISVSHLHTLNTSTTPGQQSLATPAVSLLTTRRHCRSRPEEWECQCFHSRQLWVCINECILQ